LLQRFSCSPWTLLQLTDTDVTVVDTATAVRLLVSDFRMAIRPTVTILATILITMATAIPLMVTASVITGRTMVTDITTVTMVDIVDIMADIAVGTMVVTAVDTMGDTMVDIAADIMADIMVDIAADTVADTDIPFRNSVHINHIAYS
jgi:hypothetical protein